jgi:flavin reductase (DIM6/NTAB) family NADH-FMN oxidoreductase RutF
LILICLGHEVKVIDIFRGSRYFGINVLSQAQQHVSERFARRNGDRFNGLEWHPGQTGVPLLPGTLASIECAVEQRVTSGDHDIFVGEMVSARVVDGQPLIYFASEYRELAAR